MNKIVLFDIDRTIFDADSFSNDFLAVLESKFGLNDSDIDEVKAIYREIKAEKGYFVPDLYLEKISESFSKIPFEEIKIIFWGNLTPKYIYSDSQALNEISKIARIGIFSKGDYKFQKEKIKDFMEIIREEDIYIFPDKLGKIEETFSKYKDFSVYLVDDNEFTLKEVKRISPNSITVCIKRNKTPEKDAADFNINSLFDIIPILNESR